VSRGVDLGDELRAIGLGWVTYDQLEWAANVILFLPFGLLIALMLRTKHWGILAVGIVVASTVIEVGQAVFLPGRVASFADILANTLGGMIGIGLAGLIRGIATLVRRRPDAQSRSVAAPN
jgi:glycopeptide antibiotics resistance protein